jgi:membrane protease YdiL (CAAX protease family)
MSDDPGSDPSAAPSAISGKDVVFVTLAILGLLALGILATILFVIFTAPGLPDFSKPTAGAVLFGSAATGAAMLGGVHLALVRRRGMTWAEVGFAPVPGRWIATAVALGAALVLAVSVAQHLLGLAPQGSPLKLLAPDGFDTATFIAAIVLLGLLTPLAEEVYYRGILYRWMRVRWRVPVAATASAAIFALTHPQYALPFMVLVALFGVVLALTYERTRSLWPPIALHATNNCLGLTLGYALS